MRVRSNGIELVVAGKGPWLAMRHSLGSELTILKDASHLSNIEQPAAFNKALSAFLARVA